MKENYAAKVLLTTCSECKQEENILFVTDPSSYEVAKIMWEATEDYPNRTMVMMNERTVHGEDPTETVAAAMRAADVIFGCTKVSLFHSQARKDAVAGGARFVNMADYSVEMMHAGGLYADFAEAREICAAGNYAAACACDVREYAQIVAVEETFQLTKTIKSHENGCIFIGDYNALYLCPCCRAG